MQLTKQIQIRIKGYLDEVLSHMDNMSSEEKNDTLQYLNDHIEASLERLGKDSLTIDDLELVLSEMDPPESYGEIIIKTCIHNKKLLPTVAIIISTAICAFVFYRNNKPLEKALKDTDVNVQNNTVSALTMIEQSVAAKYTATEFFTACANNDWDEAFKYWDIPRKEIVPKTKEHLGGLQVIHVGKPFKRDNGYPGWFVPYKIKLKGDNSIKEHNLAVRNDNPESRWYVDGGI